MATAVLTVTAADIVEDALLLIGAVPAEQAIPAYEQQQAEKKLNYILKMLQADGYHLWTKEEGVVFLTTSTQKYDIGPSGDHSSTSFISTTLSSAASASDTTLTLTTTTGMTGAAEILSSDPADSTQDWTTGSSGTVAINGGNLELTNGAASQGTADYTITTTVGKEYLVTITYVKGTSSGATFYALDTVDSVTLDSENLTANGTATLSFTATQTTHDIRFENDSSTSGHTSQISNVSQVRTDSGDFIGIELTDGTREWTNILSVDSSTQVTIDTALTGAAASGNTVFTYTTKLDRPERVLGARAVRTSSTDEISAEIMNYTEYMEQSDKATTGLVNNIMYSPQLTSGELYVYPTSDNVKQYLKITWVRPIDVVEASADSVDIPAEWAMALTYMLASALLPAFKTDPEKQAILDQQADIYLDKAKGYDREYAPLLIGGWYG